MFHICMIMTLNYCYIDIDVEFPRFRIALWEQTPFCSNEVVTFMQAVLVCFSIDVVQITFIFGINTDKELYKQAQASEEITVLI